ncbi:hypothetical protein E8E13_006194 [Curvularia kusanoi]|uniref:Uncharacterized protein n=1 Tax=Curvularia kusanoi TaxID=90978 RepID=A0A9P4W9F6_CURKU|nr:hypothetical protein E8E13_006194 [Curvularia kusanoi]
MDSEFSRIFSLPQELLQWILSSIANFEPWTYNTALNDADVSITDADLSSDTPVSMKQYHAVLQTVEEAHGDEAPATRLACTQRKPCNSDPLTALVAYAPVPLLKLSAVDIVQSYRLQNAPRAVLQLTAALIVVIAAFTQCREALLLALEKVESDSLLPSIEQHEGSQPNTSVRPDRLRSMSGSTVAEPYAQEQELSLSVVSTVYDSSTVKEGARKELRWAEKRESEEKDMGKEIKRPKLSDYKQVSSGRVATLMDRFEKFHI